MSLRRAQHFAAASVLLNPNLRDQVRLAWRLLRDERVPSWKFLLPVVAAGYLLAPIDPIPDFLLGVGQSDDLGVAVALMLLTVRWLPRLAPTQIVEEHAQAMTARRAPRRSGAGMRGNPLEADFRVR